MTRHGDGCEIIGEFELNRGGDYEEYFRHMKRFAMHASKSYCRKMMDSPIQLMPFRERNMPDYDTFQKFNIENSGEIWNKIKEERANSKNK